MITFSEKFLEIKMLYKAWLEGQITPLGRVAVLKSLILSKIIHLWILPHPPENVINDLLGNRKWKVWYEESESGKSGTRNLKVESLARGIWTLVF